MKKLKNKSEITARKLKSEDCDYKGHRLSFDKKENLYIRGSHFNSGVVFYETIQELKFFML